MYYNALDGVLPSELGLMTNLRELDLAINDLSGPLPSQLGRLTMLNSLDIYLTGSIPSELGMNVGQEGTCRTAPPQQCPDTAGAK